MKNYKELSRKEFNRQASFYDESKAMNISRFPKECYPFIKNKLKDKKYEFLLDMGCGTGAMLEIISKENSKANLFGLDLSEKMIEEAKKKNIPKVNCIIGDAEDLPYVSGMFDVVICNQSFHHYPNPDKAFSEVYRVLKNNGTFIVCDMYSNKVMRTLNNKVLLKLMNTGDFHSYSREEVISLFKNAGFKGITWEKATKMTFISCGLKI